MKCGFISYLIIIIFCLPCEIKSYPSDKGKYDPTTLVFPAFLHTYGIRKATRFHLLLFTQNKIKFNNPQGLSVVRLLAWEDSTTKNDDDEVTVYGVNSGQNCIIYNTSMKSLGIYGLRETGEQKLNQPNGIAANEQGDVFVADTGNNRLVKLFNPGNDLAYISCVGENGDGPGCFDQPYDVALDSRNNLYVTDTGNHRVQIFSVDLNYERSWGTKGKQPGRLFLPTAIGVTDKNFRWTYFKEEFVVVVDNGRTRIQQFDLNGNLKKEIKSRDFGFPESLLGYIAIDYYNNIYVTDKQNHCIHKFDHRLSYLTSYGKYGKGKKEFIEPRGITLHRHLGQVFVAEKWGAQYFWIGTDCTGFEIQKSEKQEKIFFNYSLTEPSFITTDILDDKKRLITRLWTNRFKRTGKQKDIWSRKIYTLDDSLKRKNKISKKYLDFKILPAGKYFAKYKIEPTYSSYHYFKKIVLKELILD